MTDRDIYTDRRQALEASFDGTIPKRRLDRPEPIRKPGDAGTVMRSIASRRRALTADAAKTDEVLARLTRHLHWLVMADRRHA